MAPQLSSNAEHLLRDALGNDPEAISPTVARRLRRTLGVASDASDEDVLAAAEALATVADLLFANHFRAAVLRGAAREIDRRAWRELYRQDPDAVEEVWGTQWGRTV